MAIASYESQWIVEWLTWHRLVGVGRFILFDIVPGGDKGGDTPGDSNGSSLSEILKPWRVEGSVLLVEVDWDGSSLFRRAAMHN